MIDLREYITAGNATFTIQSRKTGTRFTYRVRRAKAANERICESANEETASPIRKFAHSQLWHGGRGK